MITDTERTTITLAHSPDSDDAFMFYGLATHKIDTGELHFEHLLKDIQTLNEEATRGTYDVTAISSHCGDGPLQPSLGNLLELGIKGQNNIVPGDRFTNQSCRGIVPSTCAILEQDRLPRLSRQNRVQRQLQPGGATGTIR